MKIRVNVNSNDKVWRASNGQASTAYSKIGIHLLRSKLKTTGSDAQRPVLLKMALNAQRNRDLASSMQHLMVHPQVLFGYAAMTTELY